jgi:hypothetical protein
VRHCGADVDVVALLVFVRYRPIRGICTAQVVEVIPDT